MKRYLVVLLVITILVIGCLLWFLWPKDSNPPIAQLTPTPEIIFTPTFKPIISATPVPFVTAIPIPSGDPPAAGEMPRIHIVIRNKQELAEMREAIKAQKSYEKYIVRLLFIW